MELNGTKLLLILIGPVALILVLYIIIYPLHAKLFDREQPLKKQLKDKRKQFSQDIRQKIKELNDTVREKGGRLSKEEREEYSREIKALRKEFLNSSLTTTKEIIEAHREESGYNDLKKIQVSNSKTFVVSSILLTPFGLPIAFGLSSYVMPQSAGAAAYSFLLILPVLGCHLGFKAYKSVQNKKSLLLSLCINTLYLIAIASVIFKLA